MSSLDESTKRRDIPTNWDVVREVPDDSLEEPTNALKPAVGQPPTINLVAASWADAVSAIGVCTAALVGLNGAGHRAALAALPWAAGLGVAWWLVASIILVAVRQGTPGMLLAGLQFSDRIAPRRVVPVVATAAVSALLFGLPGLLGAGRSPLAVVGASALETVPVD